jgi:hypothetical protein
VKRRNERQDLVTTKLDTLPEKLNALREKFFPPLKHADLTDIGLYDYPVPLEIDEEIREKEIHEALKHVTNDKALGPDQILNRVLKTAEEWVTPKLYKLFNVTVRIGYHLKAWKSAITLALRKPNKDNYT